MRPRVYGLWFLLVIWWCVSTVSVAAEQTTLPPRLTVAVLWFEDGTGDPPAAHWRYTVTRLLANQLKEAKAIQVLSSNAVEFAFRQRKVSPGAVIDAAQARAMGELIEARRVVWGRYRRDGEQWNVTVQVLNVASGEASAELNAVSADWYEVRDRLIEPILKELSTTPSDEERAKMMRRETDSPAALELMSHAYALQIEGKAAPEIEDKVRQAVAADPQFAMAHVALAAVLSTQGKFAAAEEALRQALKIRPDDPRVDRVLGFLRLYQNNLSEAEQAFREAHRLDPDDPEPLHRLGELYGSQQKWDEAMAWWDQARRLDPTDACVRAHIGQAYAYRGEQAKAVAELKEAERFAAPEDLSVEQGIAWAYNVLGETTLAMEHYEKCVALARARGVDPDFVRRIEELVRQLKGSLTPTYVTASRPKVYTDETLEAALRERLTPEEIEGVVNPLASSPEIQRWAQELTQGGKDDLDKAKRIFDALLRHIPGKSGTRTAVEVFAAWNQPGESFNCQELAKLFVAMARDVGIQAFYVVVEKDYRGKPVPHACAAVFTEDQVLLVDPTYRWFGVPHQQFEVLDDLQSIAHQLSYSREVSSCRLAVKLYPDSVWTQMALAGALIGASQWEKTFVASILAWQPEPDLWNYFTQEAGKAQWEEARRAMEAVLRLEPDDWKAYYLQGAFAAYDGKPEEAAGYLRKALGLNPESTEAHFMLAWVLGIQGQLKEAREELRACLQHQPPSDVAEQAHRAIALINEQIGAE